MTVRRTVVFVAAPIALAVAVVVVQQGIFWWGTRAPLEEAQRLVPIAGIQAGSVVAEIGAGAGEMAQVVAPRVLPGGRLYLTEIGEAELAQLQALKTRQAWRHVEVLRGEPSGTALPDACCDVIYMRHVFHHFADAATMVSALRRATRLDGQLVVIDFNPNWALGLIAPVAHDTGGHGMRARDVIRILNSSRFRLVREEPRWTVSAFLVMFRAE